MIMPHDDTATDSELLASWTVDAIGRGRLQLAEALLKLANQARRMESAALVRMAGQTRDEQPVRAYSGPTLVRDVPQGEQEHRPVSFGHDGPTGNGDADLARAELAATAIFGKVAEQELGVPIGERCRAVDTSSGHECHQAIWWAHGHVGDASTPAVRAGWRHVDPSWDSHHEAIGS
jgi:hypothetical protein